MDEEIRYHLELERERQRRQGRDDAGAVAEALRRFGDPEWVKNATRIERGRQPFGGGMQDTGWALRALGRHPGFAMLSLVTLALGIGATTVAFTVLDTVLLRPLPYQDSHRLMLFQERTPRGDLRAYASYPNFADWRSQARAFSGVAATMPPSPQTVTVGDEPVRVPSMGVSRGFFGILGVKPFIGREFTAEENAVGGPSVVMVSHAFWRTHMGGRSSLGTLDLGGKPSTVVGVLPPGFKFIDEAELFHPHERFPGTVRSARSYRVFARLAPDVDAAVARNEMHSIARALRAQYGNDTDAVDVDVMPLREYMVGDYRMMLTIVFGAATLVLLIACTNLVSAQLARGLSRERELAVRAALGASRARLVRQLFVESGLLAVGGAVLGTGLAVLLTQAVKRIGVGLVPRLEELSVDLRVVAFSATVTIVTAMLIGLYPAFKLARNDSAQGLRAAGRGTSGARRSLVWPVLVGFEIAMGVVLLIGSSLLVRTMGNILGADTGFEARGLATAAFVPGKLELPELERIRAELAGLPGVRGVAYTTRLPLAWGSYSAPVLRPTDPPDHDWPALAGLRVVSADYFAVVRQPLLRGRPFTESDRVGSMPVAIVTPGIVDKLWPGQDPIGKLVRSNFLGDQLLTVVGVVNEASSWTAPRGTQNEIYVPLAQQPREARFQLISMLRTDGDASAIIPAVRARLRQLAPQAPAQFGTMEERIRRSAADRRFAMIALVLFGGIAIVLAGIGIYGVMSYSVVTRTREIGVRMALGATPAGVQAHVLRAAAAMAVGGIVAGLIAGSVATRYLQSVLYGVTRLDPFAYGAGACILLVTALLGAYLPARRSSRIDPLTAIRAE